ncbi:Uncharacterized protein APZ42_011443 [Daphnia magna]|uniref:Uncharacterized protein n=1 Tax=Daphnia magna TaxID=35525 RepID=A0A162CZ58_9CRUS|nr:Uncharacterized protein APZ42_011443 [Daphnia magna]
MEYLTKPAKMGEYVAHRPMFSSARFSFWLVRGFGRKQVHAASRIGGSISFHRSIEDTVRCATTKKLRFPYK